MDSRRRSFIKMTLWVGLAGAALVLWTHVTQRIRLVAPAEGQPAPPLALRSADGGELALEDYRGRVIVLNLWASWCAPCRDEIPLLSRLDAHLRARGLAVVGINAEEFEPEELGRVEEALQIEYADGTPAAPLTGLFAATDALPTTWLIDRAGRVRGLHRGRLQEGALRAACERLLDEPLPETAGSDSR